MKILSLFDGISCARVALERAGIDVKTYYACEIEKNAIKVSEKNYPDIVRLGDVRNVVGFDVDLLIGGSPCQDLSIAKKDRKGLDGDRSGLFWEFVRLKKECNPRWFVLENVASMPKVDRDIITREMGVEPVMINAALVSAQCRKRLFWTNIQFDMPVDRGILLKDIIQDESEVDERMIVKGISKPVVLNDSPFQILVEGRTELGKQSRKDIRQQTGKDSTSRSAGNKAYFGRDAVKANCLTTRLGAEGVIVKNSVIRKLTPIECERLQSLPDGYTEGICKTSRYKVLGNAFNVEVVAAILRGVVTPEQTLEISKKARDRL